MKAIIRSCTVVILSVAILKQPLFFAFLGILGIQHEGSDSSIIYVTYLSVIFFFTLAVYILSFVKRKVYTAEIAAFWLVAFIFGSHLFWVIFDPMGTALFPEFMVLFVVLGLPGVAAAFAIIRLKVVDSVIRFSEVLFIVIALGICLFSVLPSLAGTRTASLAGASYQVLSYYSAFTAGMLFLYNFTLPTELRYSFASSIFHRLFSLALMMGCAVGVFVGGGRGAFVLLLAYGAFFLVASLPGSTRGLTLNQLKKALVRALTVTALVSLFLMLFWDQEFIQSGYARATQFISPDGGVDLARGSSGRDLVYAEAIKYIAESPLLGYGPLGFREKTIHAHNVFLELTLQFGVMGLLACLLFAIFLISRSVRNWSAYNLWALALMIYPFINTMFSAAAMHSSVYLFSIVFLAVSNKRRQNLWEINEFGLHPPSGRIVGTT